jgi:transposase
VFRGGEIKEEFDNIVAKSRSSKHYDEYAIYNPLQDCGYAHKTVCHGVGEYAGDEDGDGFCKVHVNTMEGFWSLLRSWLRPYRSISQEKLPLYLSFFEFVHKGLTKNN